MARSVLTGAAGCFLAAAAFASEGPGDVAAAPVTAEPPLVSHAGAYAAYIADVDALGASRFESVGELDAALEAASSHGPGDLTGGWIAYAALVASRNTEFADGVQAASDHLTRDTLLTALSYDVTYAGKLPGADSARGAVRTEAHDHFARIRQAKSHVRDQAYSLQNETWATRFWDMKGERLARYERADAVERAAPEIILASHAPADVDVAGLTLVDSEADLWRAFQIAPSARAGSMEAVVTPASLTVAPAPSASVAERPLDRALTLAAYLSVDAAPQELPAADVALKARGLQACLKAARLAMMNCVGAAAKPYEAPFCLAEHSLGDVSACFEG